MEPIITTEVENALLLMSYELAGYRPTREWQPVSPTRGDVSVFEEREANRRAALRVLDILYDVDREFQHIALGLIDDG